jgi:hypothetical protein
MARHDDDFDLATEDRCVREKLLAALRPGGASERPDSPPGEIARVLALWPVQPYGDRLEWIESMDRATVLAVYEHTLEHMVAPRVIEV